MEDDDDIIQGIGYQVYYAMMQHTLFTYGIYIMYQAGGDMPTQSKSESDRAI